MSSKIYRVEDNQVAEERSNWDEFVVECEDWYTIYCDNWDDIHADNPYVDSERRLTDDEIAAFHSADYSGVAEGDLDGLRTAIGEHECQLFDALDCTEQTCGWETISVSEYTEVDGTRVDPDERIVVVIDPRYDLDADGQLGGDDSDDETLCERFYLAFVTALKAVAKDLGLTNVTSVRGSYDGPSDETSTGVEAALWQKAHDRAQLGDQVTLLEGGFHMCGVGADSLLKTETGWRCVDAWSRDWEVEHVEGDTWQIN